MFSEGYRCLFLFLYESILSIGDLNALTHIRIYIFIIGVNKHIMYVDDFIDCMEF